VRYSPWHLQHAVVQLHELSRLVGPAIHFSSTAKYYVPGDRNSGTTCTRASLSQKALTGEAQMQRSADIVGQPEDGRISVSVLEEIGKSLRASLDSTTEGLMPREMALLLLRLALVEVIASFAGEEMREDGLEETPQQGARGSRVFRIGSRRDGIVMRLAASRNQPSFAAS
jgi:hypothetical protein